MGNAAVGPDDALVQTLYASVTSDDALSDALGLLARRFSCRSAVLMYVDPARPDADIAIAYGAITPEAQRRYREEFSGLDPAPGAMARLPVGSATTTDRLFTPELKAESRFFTEFYTAALGLSETLGGPIANKDGRFGILAVHRGPDRPPFDDGEIQLFESLMRHVTQAIELRRAFFEVETQAAGLAETVDMASVALMIFTPSGRLTHANMAARRIVARGDGLGLTRAGQLFAADQVASRRLLTCFNGGQLPAVLRVPRVGRADSYTLHVSALQNEATLPWRTGSGVLVKAHDPDSDPGDATALLALAFDLPLPAARLVAALLRGTSLETYARQQAISTNTVKFHLKAAFAATGARRQADLVRIAGALVRDLGSPDPVRRPPPPADGG
jgi:hypothetical protein